MGKWKDSELSLHVDATYTVVEKIVKEELIAMTWKGSILQSFGFVNPMEFKGLLKREKVLISVSWQGTYIRNYNGEWSDPFPDDETE